MATVFHVGTSGFSYKPWKGSFYPDDLADADMLRFYGERLDTVEINNTFYRMPKAEMLAAWAAQVPNDFRFVIKAPQRITHMKRLKECDEPMAVLLEVVQVLGDRLGPLLFQLPPNMKKDVPRLQAFLALLPAGSRAAFEFRNATWFDDEVYGVLREHRSVLCLADVDEGAPTPFVATADWGYLRLRRAEYGDAELSSWIGRVRAEPWREVFVFFKHEDEGTGPRFARRFKELLQRG